MDLKVFAKEEKMREAAAQRSHELTLSQNQLELARIQLELAKTQRETAEIKARSARTSGSEPEGEN